MMQPIENNRALKVMHYSFCFGLLLNLIIFLFMIHDGEIGMPIFSTDIIKLLPLVVAVLGIIRMKSYFTKNVTDVIHNVYASENIGSYRKRKIRQWAPILGAGLINEVTYFLTGNSLYFIVTIILVVILFLNKPKEFIH